MAIYRTIGMMSGTSLDGLDIALVEFENKQEEWSFKLLKAESFPYNESIRQRLKDAENGSARQLVETDHWFGNCIGELCRDFIEGSDSKPELVSSHGQTIFHQPELGYSTQIGNGYEIRKWMDCPIVYDFRSMDISLGGQGAPLVPVGELLLFQNYSCFLNIGGFANLSTRTENNMEAYDICPANIILNEYASLYGKAFDENGTLAASGEVNHELLEKLNALDFYQLKGPKSLGAEWLENNFKSVLVKAEPVDMLRTLVEHIAIQIAKNLDHVGARRVLCTGGGVYNSFLIEQIRKKTSTELVIPEDSIIAFKEAIIFSFLGLLRYLEQNNSLGKVTGAAKDSCGGILLP